MNTCAFAATHHSDDTVAVHHGDPEPLLLCGYHAQPAWLDTVLRSRTLRLRDGDGNTYRPGDEGAHVLPWSEVCMYLGVAGKHMRFRVLAQGVQLLNEHGATFTAPITHGEAGLYTCR